MSGPRCAQHPCSSRYPGCLPPTWGTATVDTGKTHLKHQLSWDTFSWQAPCSLRLATYSRVRGWDLTRTCEMGSRPRHPCSPGPRHHRAVPSAASSFPTYKTGTRPTRDLTHWGCLCTLREHLGNILLAHATACPPPGPAHTCIQGLNKGCNSSVSISGSQTAIHPGQPVPAGWLLVQALPMSCTGSPGRVPVCVIPQCIYYPMLGTQLVTEPVCQERQEALTFTEF